ncbi:MAG: hypothetical protein ACSW8E_02040 [Clostridia bacterium]
MPPVEGFAVSYAGAADPARAARRFFMRKIINAAFFSVKRGRGRENAEFFQKGDKKCGNPLDFSFRACYTVKAFRTEADFLSAWPVSGWEERGNFRRNKTNQKKEKSKCQSYP